jgi:hypothetical protein
MPYLAYFRNRRLASGSHDSIFARSLPVGLDGIGASYGKPLANGMPHVPSSIAGDNGPLCGSVSD